MGDERNMEISIQPGRQGREITEMETPVSPGRIF